MQNKSNKTILRELRKATYKFIRQTHDLEKGGKRKIIITKKFGHDILILLMLMHLRNLLESSLNNTHNNQIQMLIERYFKKYDSYVSVLQVNCNCRRPLRKKIVSNMLTAHTNMFKSLLSVDMELNAIKPIDLLELSGMMQTAVVIWKNGFKK